MISVSDLMAGLMMVFLFIAVIMQRMQSAAQNVTEIVNEWQDTELAIYEALEENFAKT